MAQLWRTASAVVARVKMRDALLLAGLQAAPTADESKVARRRSAARSSAGELAEARMMPLEGLCSADERSSTRPAILRTGPTALLLCPADLCVLASLCLLGRQD